MTSRQPAHNEPRREAPPRDTPQRGFQLLLYFSIASGIAVLIVTMVLSWAYYLKEVDDNVKATELRNLGLAIRHEDGFDPLHRLRKILSAFPMIGHGLKRKARIAVDGRDAIRSDAIRVLAILRLIRERIQGLG